MFRRIDPLGFLAAMLAGLAGERQQHHTQLLPTRRHIRNGAAGVN